MLNQSNWRKAGAVSIALAAAMAVLSVPTGLLRDTVVRVTALFAEEAAEIGVRHPWWVLMLFWPFLLALILASLYFAMLDIRYIRLQYALEKRRIVQDTVNDESFRTRLSEASKDRD